jgi:tetratricopeptide (TPR) repeat protein
MTKTIFLSTVTNEFLPLRRRLAGLANRTKRMHVRHQDDFINRGVLTLQMLEEEVGRLDLVIHLIGSRAGAAPPIEQVEEFLARHPEFAIRFPEVADAAGKSGVSYTQWEAWLALYFAAMGQPIGLCCYEPVETRAGREASQGAHVERLAKRKIYPKVADSEHDAVDEVVLTLIEMGCLTDEESRQIIHLPYPSIGTLFKGREDSLTQLQKSLARPAGRATAITGKAVHGLGGVGKTRLAVEFAWERADDCSAVLFVTADSPSGLRQNLAELVGPLVLDLPEQQATEEDVRVGAALRWLQDHPGWFLILDNVDTEAAAEQVEELLAQLHGGHVLITSRLANWGEHVEPLELDVLSEESAARFLLERTAPRPNGRGRRTEPTDAADATRLARELDGLALALEQAGAFIVHQRISLAEYHQLWKSHEPAVQQWHRPRDMKYPRSVAVTWQTTLDQLPPAEVALMNLLAWLAPEPVPLGWFESEKAATIWDGGIERLQQSEPLGEPGAVKPVVGAGDVSPLNAASTAKHANSGDSRPPLRKARVLRNAIAALADFSMLRWDATSGTVIVHRVVQEILRTRQTEPTEWLTGTLQLLSAAVPSEIASDVRTWPAWEPLRPHVVFTTAEGERLNIADPTSDLMGGLGTFLSAKALQTEAEQYKRSALAIDERAHGSDSPQVAIRLNNLAQTLQATNRLAEAEPLMRRALAIDEQSYGAEHPDVAIDLNNLAQLLQATNRLAEAEPLMRRALAIDEQSYGAEHPNVAAELWVLAVLLWETERLPEALPLMSRAMRIYHHFSKQNGYEHPDWDNAAGHYRAMLTASGRSQSDIDAALRAIMEE